MNNSTSPVEKLLSLLEGVKTTSPGHWMALCPAHDDHNPSLSISIDNGTILVHCMAGCETKIIIKKIELTMADLFMDSYTQRSHPIEAIYHYIDANGKPFEVVRTRPKGFYQRQPNGKGSYVRDEHGKYVMAGIVYTLYHQDELPAAILTSQIIYIAEGEKDVDNIRSLSLVATCNPMGAGKWKPEYSEILRGAIVVIVADKDKAGRDHAQEVARSLSGKARTIKVLELPGEGVKDASDWLKGGKNVSQLNELVKACPEWQPIISQASQPLPMSFALTDLGNAERFKDQFGDIVHYSWERRRWLAWDNMVWQWDDGECVMRLAKTTVRKIYEEASLASDKAERQAIADWAKASESEARLVALLSLARSEPDIPVKIRQLDQNPWLLNCANGTLDLRTGQLNPHLKQDLITVVLPVRYDPNATCPIWEKFLEKIMAGNQAMVGYLQRLSGYSLTGITRAQMFIFLYGLGSNGKSTFVNTLRELLMDYATRVSNDVLMVKDRSSSSRGHNEGLANLQGKRLVLSSETEDSQKLAVSLIKDMTGGESIKTSRKHEHEVEFQPIFKLWLFGNHKPRITDTTCSIWRRVKLVPFGVTISETERDESFPTKLKIEYPGILAWAVRGCLEWQKIGLAEPEDVKAATANYRIDEDILASFFEDCCVFGKQMKVEKNMLKKVYEAWCIRNDNQQITQTAFKSRLFEKGITEGKSGSVRNWKGLGLNSFGNNIVPHDLEVGQMGRADDPTPPREGGSNEKLQNSPQNVPLEGQDVPLGLEKPHEPDFHNESTPTPLDDPLSF